MLHWIGRLNLFFLLLVGLHILNGLGIIGNISIHPAGGIITLLLILLVLAFIPFHIIALSKSATEIIDKNTKYSKYKRLVSKTRFSSFYYTILGFLYILAMILSGVGTLKGINHKIYHSILAFIFPAIIIYVFAKQYYLASILYRIEDKILAKSENRY